MRCITLIVAEGGTSFTHMVTIGRSASPWGPFESCPRNPILTNMQARVLDIHCIGHGDLVQDHTGKWWMVFLGIRIAQKYMSTWEEKPSWRLWNGMKPDGR